MSAYVPLWCKSHYSFLEGASAPDALVDEAQRLGLRSLALTDRDGVYGIVRAHEHARALGAQVLIGAQVTIKNGSHLLLLAQERRGYAQLCRLLTMGHGRAPKGRSAVTWEEVAAHAPGLLALWGGEGSVLIRAKLTCYVVDTYKGKRPGAKEPEAWYGARRRRRRAGLATGVCACARPGPATRRATLRR